ncbi:MAG: hypothetical protein ACE5ID_12965, partial [Acidobacteriota bacterium]
SDERAFYYQATGLLLSGRGAPLPSRRHRWVADGMAAAERGPQVLVRDSVGFFGYFAGSNVHVIDRFGLGDPLLARLPPVQTAQWRPGHFFRAVPAGYVDSLDSGRNKLVDRHLAEYYDHLHLITHGPLWSFKRLTTVVKMNLGFYDSLIDADLYRHAGMIVVNLREPSASTALYASRVEEAPWTIGPPGIEFRLGRLAHGRRLGLSLDHDDNYRVDLLLKGREIGRLTVWAWPLSAAGLVDRVVDLPWAAAASGFDAIRVLPKAGRGTYQAGRPWLPD